MVKESSIETMAEGICGRSVRGSIRPVASSGRWGLLLLFSTLGALFFGGCTDKGKLSFEILLPEGEDPFEGVTTVVIKAGDTQKTATITGAGQPFSIKLTLSAGTETRLEVQGQASDGTVLASGITPPLYIVDSSQLLRVWVSRVGQMSLHPTRMEKKAGQLAFADYELQDWDEEEDDRLFTYWFGGCDSSGMPVDTAGYYDPYSHQIFVLPDLSDSEAWNDPAKAVAPRCGSVAMNVETGTFLIFGGKDTSGLPTDSLTLATSKSDGYYYWPIGMECDDGIDNDGDELVDLEDPDCSSKEDLTEGSGREWARTHAQAVALGPYSDLTDGESYQVLNSFLVTGGWGFSGRVDTALHLLAELSLTGYTYLFRMEQIDLLAGRAAHTATLSLVEESGVQLRSVLLYGGTEDASGVPVAETLQFQLSTTTPEIGWTWNQQPFDTYENGEPLPRLTGHAAVALPDGRIMVAGGRDPADNMVINGVIYNPRSSTINRVPDLLPEGRAGHTLSRTGYTILMAGGFGPSGELAEQALVIKINSLTGAMEEVVSIPMKVPRWGHAAFVMANGQIMVAGGFDSQDQPLDVIEVYNPESS